MYYWKNIGRRKIKIQSYGLINKYVPKMTDSLLSSSIVIISGNGMATWSKKEQNHLKAKEVF
jgi:hypothetical protein